MKRVGLRAGIVLSAALIALTIAADGPAAGAKTIEVSLTASGPKPSAVTKAPYEWLEFVNHDSVSHTVSLARNPQLTCSLDVAPGETIQCRDGAPTSAGKYTYTVDGTFQGAVTVVPYSRSVSLTGATHAVRAGRQVTLHGRLRVQNGAARCGRVTPIQIRILDRHRHGQTFKRVAVVGVSNLQYPGPSRGLSSYSWRLTVRPGTATTYMAETVGQTQICEQARSRPFAVTVRR